MAKNKKTEAPEAQGAETKNCKPSQSNRHSNRRGRNARATKQSDYRHATNDPRWYLEPNRITVESASRFPFRLLPGYKSSLPLYTSQWVDKGDPLNPLNRTVEGVAYDLARTVPGVIGFNWVPFLGTTSTTPDPLSAMNQASENRYLFIRHANSGGKNYEAVDLQLVMLAACQIVSLLASARKVYGLIGVKKFENGCLSDDVMLASGWDPAAVRAHGADFAWKINDVITKMRNVWVPNNIPIVHRWEMLGKAFFMDEDDARCQFYTFKQNGFYRYNSTLTTEDEHVYGGLEYVPLDVDEDDNVQLLTPSLWYDIVIEAIERITTDDNVATMWGDVLKAYGNEAMFEFQPLDLNYVTAPEYDPVMLTQIENAWMAGCAAAPPDIVQYVPADPNSRPVLTYGSDWQYRACPGLNACYLYSNHNDPTVEEIVELTRFAKVMTTEDGNPVVYGGSEWLFSAEMWSNKTKLGQYDSVFPLTWADGTATLAMVADDMNKNLARVANWSYFYKAPKLYVCQFKYSASKAVQYVSMYGELYNATAMDAATMKDHWAAASYNLWNANSWGT